jgi:ABC-type polysaccharide/polyol phosphate transport system ATPase subunit
LNSVIKLEDVHKRYRIYRQRYQSIKEIVVHRRLGEWQDHWALRGVSLEVKPGASLGLVGPNGAGKSTALKLMARILTPDRGRIRIARRVSGLLELGAGFQLDYTGRENIYLNASLLGLTRKEIERKYEWIVDFSELGHAIDDPLRTYSSGMYMRLAFSIAIHVDPEVLLVDEILAVGDQSFQQKCLERITKFQRAGGTIVMVTHSLGMVQDICTDAAWIEDGQLKQFGSPVAVVNAYLDHVRERDQARADKEADEAPQRAVELGEVRLLDRQGRRAHVLEIGDPLTVEIPYRVNRRIDDPMLGVALFRNDGVYLYGTNTNIDGISMSPIGEDGVAQFSYSSLPLLPGTYRIAVGVFERSDPDNPIDHHDKLYSFRVISDSDEQGLVHLDHDWLVDESLAPRSKRDVV